MTWKGSFLAKDKRRWDLCESFGCFEDKDASVFKDHVLSISFIGWALGCFLQGVLYMFVHMKCIESTKHKGEKHRARTL